MNRNFEDDAIKELPDKKTNQYPERVTVAVSSDVKRKLKTLKDAFGKDPSEIVRRAIDKELKDIAI